MSSDMESIRDPTNTIIIGSIYALITT